MFVFPLLAAGVAGALTWDCARRARTEGSVALGVWAVALAQFALASGLLAWGAGLGWTGVLYRAYYLFGAVLNVLWLGLGTVWFLAPGPARRTASVLALAVTVYAGLVVGADPLVPGAGEALATAEIPAGDRVVSDRARLLSRWSSIAGSLAVLGGLGWSALRRRSSVRGLALLASGVLVVAGASVVARLGAVLPFSIGLALGVGLMYLGFRRA